MSDCKIGPSLRNVIELNSARRLASKAVSDLNRTGTESLLVGKENFRIKSDNHSLRVLAHANSAKAALLGRITPPLINDIPYHKSSLKQGDI